MENILIRDGKNSDPGSGINIPDPQHWIRDKHPGSAILKGKSLENKCVTVRLTELLTMFRGSSTRLRWRRGTMPAASSSGL
jgi:hypothetical protein